MPQRAFRAVSSSGIRGFRGLPSHLPYRRCHPFDRAAAHVAGGERYDVTVAAGDGVFPLVALAEGKNAVARALPSTGTGTPPNPGFQPPELNGRVGTVDTFTATPADDFGSAKPDTTLTAELSGGMANYDWKINARAYPDVQPLPHPPRTMGHTHIHPYDDDVARLCTSTATPFRS